MEITNEKLPYFRSLGLTNEQWYFLSGNFANFVNMSELKTMANRAVDLGFDAPDLSLSSPVKGFSQAVECLDELLHEPERVLYREIVNSPGFPGVHDDRIPSSTAAYLESKVQLAVFLGIIGGNIDQAREVGNLDHLAPRAVNSHFIENFSEFYSTLIDYVRSDEHLPFAWWANLNGRA